MTDQKTQFKLIRAKYLIDGNGGAPIKDGAVLLEGTKIRASGTQQDVRVPDGVIPESYDFPESTVLPGLVDVHTHLNYPGDGTHTNDVMSEEDDILLMQSILNARDYLALGVTTIRDNGSKNNTTLSLKEGIRRGLAVGPRLVLCANPLTITGGHMWQMGAEADGVDEVIKGVRSLVKRGADYIKVAVTGGTTLGSYPNLPAYNLDELKAIVWEAHKFQRLVAAHAHASAGISNAVEAGIDMIIHCTWREPDGTSVYREDIANRIVEAGAWVNPTLDQTIGAPSEILLEKERAGELDEEGKARVEELKRAYPVRLEQINKMVKLGVKFVTGTDCGWGPVPFNRIHREMHIFVESGMSPMQAIVTATKDAAESLGLGDTIGTLEPGKEADVTVIAGEPHRDVNDITKVEAVFQAGNQVR